LCVIAELGKEIAKRLRGIVLVEAERTARVCRAVTRFSVASKDRDAQQGTKMHASGGISLYALPVASCAAVCHVSSIWSADPGARVRAEAYVHES
jgi:hypothetical protein